MTILANTLPLRAQWGWVMLAVILWIAAYASLTPFADAVLALTGLSRQTHPGEALHFFIYDTPKVLLLTGIVFVMGIVHTFISPERTRAFLSGRRLEAGNVLAGGVPHSAQENNSSSCNTRASLRAAASAMKRGCSAIACSGHPMSHNPGENLKTITFTLNQQSGNTVLLQKARVLRPILLLGRDDTRGLFITICF